MKTLQEMVRTASGTPIWVSGTGPTVILVHGVLMDHRMWAGQVNALSAHHRVCCMDMLGHGDAPDPPGERSLHDFVTQVHEVVELFSDAGPPVLGGFSMGGLIAQAYAIQYHAALRGLIIMNAVYNRSPEQAAIVRTRSERMRANGVSSAIESSNSRWFTDADRTMLAAKVDEILGWMRDGEFVPKCKAHWVFVTSDPEIVGKLGVISCPALVMTGDGDAGSTPQMAQEIAAAISCSELHILDRQRHMMSVLDAQRVNAILLAFLDRHASISA